MGLLEQIKRNSKKLALTFQGRKILVDDESYFKLKSDFLPGNDHFFTKVIENTPASVKYRTIKKFTTLMLIWACISADEVSHPVFIERPNSINGEIYHNHCIKDKLMKFINSYYKKDNSIIFWPDLATAHYAKATTDLLTDINVPFVLKEDNPPNIPQCRPIENFLANLKAEVYRDGWEAKSVRQLKQRIRSKLHTIDMQSVKNDFASLIKKLKCVGRKGLFSVV